MYKYDYEKDKCKCPKCKGLGFPWMGYFSCEDCEAIFFIETGEEVEVMPDKSVRRSTSRNCSNSTNKE